MPAPLGPGEADELALVDVERDVAQRVGALPVRLGDRSQRNHVAWHSGVGLDQFHAHAAETGGDVDAQRQASLVGAQPEVDGRRRPALHALDESRTHAQRADLLAAPLDVSACERSGLQRQVAAHVVDRDGHLAASRKREGADQEERGNRVTMVRRGTEAGAGLDCRGIGRHHAHDAAARRRGTPTDRPAVGPHESRAGGRSGGTRASVYVRKTSRASKNRATQGADTSDTRAS